MLAACSGYPGEIPEAEHMETIGRLTDDGEDFELTVHRLHVCIILLEMKITGIRSSTFHTNECIIIIICNCYDTVFHKPTSTSLKVLLFFLLHTVSFNVFYFSGACLITCGGKSG